MKRFISKIVLNRWIYFVDFSRVTTALAITLLLSSHMAYQSLPVWFDIVCHVHAIYTHTD